VIVDVLNKVRPAQKNNEGIYDYDVRSLEGLQSLAAEFGIAIIVVHHTRKAEAEDPFDCLSGSTGLSGTADATLVLARDSQGVTLYGRGRDIEEIETALSFDRSTGHWSILGAVADMRRSDERTTVLQSLKDASEPMSPRDIADDTGMPYQNVRQLLVRMGKAGEVTKVQRGFYIHPDTPVTTITKSQTRRIQDYTEARDGDDDE
jgi:RecA-family ATPase